MSGYDTLVCFRCGHDPLSCRHDTPLGPTADELGAAAYALLHQGADEIEFLIDVAARRHPAIDTEWRYALTAKMRQLANAIDSSGAGVPGTHQ